MNRVDIKNKEFEVHLLNERGLEAVNEIALAFDELLEKLKKHCTEGQHLTLCSIMLESAAFYAKKSCCIRDDHQLK